MTLSFVRDSTLGSVQVCAALFHHLTHFHQFALLFSHFSPNKVRLELMSFEQFFLDYLVTGLLTVNWVNNRFGPLVFRKSRGPQAILDRLKRETLERRDSPLRSATVNKSCLSMYLIFVCMIHCHRVKIVLYSGHYLCVIFTRKQSFYVYYTSKHPLIQWPL